MKEIFIGIVLAVPSILVFDTNISIIHEMEIISVIPKGLRPSKLVIISVRKLESYKIKIIYSIELNFSLTPEMDN